MFIDPEFFGYGAGLVLVGWMAGMMVGAVFAIIRRIGGGL